MSNNSIEAEAAEETLASIHTDPDPPPGIEKERVHPATLETIHHLFGERGVQFIALLLRSAMVKQIALPGLPVGGDVAIVEVQSLRVLASNIGWSYDTTEKYALVFCALSLFHKHRQRRQITIHFPLAPYILPANAGEELDTLLAKRPKVVSFAAKVRRRLARIDQAPGRTFTHSPAKDDQRRPEDIKPLIDLASAIQDVRQLLHQKVDSPALRDELVTSFTGILRYRCRLSHDLVDSKHAELGAGREQKSTFADQKGDFPSSEDDHGQQESRHSSAKVDSHATEAIGSLPFRGKKKDSQSQLLLQKSTVPSQKGDSHSGTPLQNSRLSPQATSESPEMVDSEILPPVGNAPNVNVITIIDSITLNVSTVALFCCKALKEAPSKRGIYSKLFREVDSDKQAITAALLYTLVHREDGTIRKPPAVFIQRCKDYHREGVPEEVAALVQRYGQLTYPKLLEALQRPAAPAVQPMSHAQREASAHQTPASLQPLSSVKVTPAPRIPLNAGGGMQREDALRLRAQIAGDQRVGLCRVGIVSLADGTYAVLVDNTLTEIVRQVVFYSIHEWQVRSAHLTYGHELFVQERQAKPHPLHALPNKGDHQ